MRVLPLACAFPGNPSRRAAASCCTDSRHKHVRWHASNVGQLICVKARELAGTTAQAPQEARHAGQAPTRAQRSGPAGPASPASW